MIINESGGHRGSSFDKGLAVLGFVLDHDGARVEEIADGLGIPASSVYRFVRSLRQAGFVTETAGRYSSGARLEPHPASGRATLSTIITPFLQHLSEVTGETAVLTVRRGLHAVCVSQVESVHQIRLAFELGQLLPLYAGAGQRVLLAFAPEEIQRAVLASQLKPATPDTPSRTELARVLERIRADGYALSRGELYAGSVAVAMPVLSGEHAVASVALAGPASRCTVAWRDRARRELTAAVDSISAGLAEHAPPP